MGLRPRGGWRLRHVYKTVELADTRSLTVIWDDTCLLVLVSMFIALPHGEFRLSFLLESNYALKYLYELQKKLHDIMS